jgi:Tfp pilus assembly protein FimT
MSQVPMTKISNRLLISKSLGMTMVELVMVIMIMAIIAVSVSGKLFTTDGITSSAFASQLTSIFRYAQMMAVNKNRTICVYKTNSFVQIKMASAQAANDSQAIACDTTIETDPNGLTDSKIDIPNKIIIDSNGNDEIRFDPYGRLYSGQSVSNITYSPPLISDVVWTVDGDQRVIIRHTIGLVELQ